MLVEGTLEERDNVAAQYLHLRPRPVFAAIGALLAVVCIFVLIAVQSLIMLGIAAYLAIWFLAVIPWLAKRNYRQYKALSEPVSIEVRVDGLYFKRENGEALVPWSEIVKWRHGKNLLLLYPASNIFHIIPKHFFTTSEEYGVFIQTLKEQIGNAT